MDGFISFLVYAITLYLFGYWLFVVVLWVKLLYKEWKGKEDPRPTLEEGVERFYELNDQLHGKGWREKKEELKPYQTFLNKQETEPEKDHISWDVKKVQFKKS